MVIMHIIQMIFLGSEPTGSVVMDSTSHYDWQSLDSLLATFIRVKSAIMKLLVAPLVWEDLEAVRGRC